MATVNPQPPSAEIEAIDRDKLILMLRRENELRLDPKTIFAMEERRPWRNYTDFVDYPYAEAHVSGVVEDLQVRVAREFGYVEEEARNYALDCLRSAVATYPDDQELMSSANYIKFNRAREGTLNIGDPFVDVPVATLRGETIPLSELLSDEQPNVVMAGSWT